MLLPAYVCVSRSVWLTVEALPSFLTQAFRTLPLREAAAAVAGSSCQLVALAVTGAAAIYSASPYPEILFTSPLLLVWQAAAETTLVDLTHTTTHSSQLSSKQACRNLLAFGQ